ncbi:MAG: aryl-sulfate sulfotransferase [Lactobacillus amylovorus]|nr:aryl-sulfate sulfotransferase [Lactobacillus amylovorus]MCI1531507.1 aryl-sulfate sulfotransferase [Lactobacillus amylovorus]
MKSNKAVLLLALGTLMLIEPAMMLYDKQVETVTAEKKNTNAQKTKLSDSQIIKNLGVKKVANSDNDKLTAKYANIVKQQHYTWENPYIKVNPYENSPLTALMVFHTDKPAKISYRVIGKTENTTIENKVKGYQTDHQVPIVGLYAGYDNSVEVTMTDQAGEKQVKVVKIKTSKLPSWISKFPIKVTVNDKSKMNLGSNELTVLDRSTKQTFAVDGDGEVRWYYLRWDQHIFEQLDNGHILLFNKIKSGDEKYNMLVETDYLGRVYRQFSFDKTLGKSYAGEGVSLVHHDVVEKPNGNWLLTVHDGSKYVEDTIAELDPNTGKIVKVIDFKKIFPESMYKNSKIKANDNTSSGLGLMDWLHINTISYDDKTGNILLSARNQDMIWSMNYQTNKINWIFSSKPESQWPSSFRKYLLKPSSGTKYPGGQHGVYILNEENNKLNVLLYDNNIVVTNGDKKQSGKFSAATEYQIDTKQKTIKQVWSYGKNLGKKNFTEVIGYAQRLDNGNTLINFGFKNKGKESNIIEVDAYGNQVFNLTLENSVKDMTYVYRAYRMQFYPDNYIFDATK